MILAVCFTAYAVVTRERPTPSVAESHPPSAPGNVNVDPPVAVGLRANKVEHPAQLEVTWSYVYKDSVCGYVENVGDTPFYGEFRSVGPNESLNHEPSWYQDVMVQAFSVESYRDSPDAPQKWMANPIPTDVRSHFPDKSSRILIEPGNIFLILRNAADKLVALQENSEHRLGMIDIKGRSENRYVPSHGTFTGQSSTAVP